MDWWSIRFTGKWTNFDGLTAIAILNGRSNSNGTRDTSFAALDGAGNSGVKIKKRTDGKYISVGGNDYNGVAEATNYVRFLNDGFQVQSIYTFNNASLGDYIFMCFAS